MLEVPLSGIALAQCQSAPSWQYRVPSITCCRAANLLIKSGISRLRTSKPTPAVHPRGWGGVWQPPRSVCWCTPNGPRTWQGTKLCTLRPGRYGLWPNESRPMFVHCMDKAAIKPPNGCSSFNRKHRIPNGFHQSQVSCGSSIGWSVSKLGPSQVVELRLASFCKHDQISIWPTLSLKIPWLVQPNRRFACL